jgi:DNA-binding protein HU-beta
MNKSELVKEMAEATNLTLKSTEAALDALINNITQVLSHQEKITLMGFGTFEVSNRAARVGRNPKTGETINIPATANPKFKPGKALKEAVTRIKSK